METEQLIKQFTLEELAKFLVKAKTNTYAAGGKEIAPQRPGFKELEFSEGDWKYRDSYAGFYFAPGQEIVRFKEQPIWTMAYSGGMLPEHHGHQDLAKLTFAFLKKALMLVKESKPFRGPDKFDEAGFAYLALNEGDITEFKGVELIWQKGNLVFKQNYIGGLIVPK